MICQICIFRMRFLLVFRKSASDKGRMNENIIAVDGPAGSGKSSVAREIAGRTDFHYLDSGALYRGVTFYFFEKYKNLKPEKKFSEWFSSYNYLPELPSLKFEFILEKPKENILLLNGRNISAEIRTPEVTEEIKYLAPLLEIRNFVNEILHGLARQYKLIMDGRDIGTEVFPDAKRKFFLTADPEVRAERRWLELKEKGIVSDRKELLSDIIRRDESDKNRKIAPLRQANDAILIDTSGLEKKAVIELILSKI